MISLLTKTKRKKERNKMPWEFTVFSIFKTIRLITTHQSHLIMNKSNTTKHFCKSLYIYFVYSSSKGNLQNWYFWKVIFILAGTDYRHMDILVPLLTYRKCSECFDFWQKLSKGMWFNSVRINQLDKCVMWLTHHIYRI